MPPKGKPYKFNDTAKKQAYKAMEETGNRQAAADAAGVSLVTIERAVAGDPEFKRRLEQSKNRFTLSLEKEAIRRAVEGWLEPRMGAGGIMYDVRKFDSGLLLHLLKKADPQKHGDSIKVDQTTTQITTDMGLDQFSPEFRARFEELLKEEVEKHAAEEESQEE